MVWKKIVLYSNRIKLDTVILISCKCSKYIDSLPSSQFTIPLLKIDCQEMYTYYIYLNLCLFIFHSKINSLILSTFNWGRLDT